ncbi:MAG: synthase subunit [Actinomycetia bacterium]|nr:synthase subunit [Actinomycetes bacterium]
MVLALEFPPISHLVEWPDIFLKGNDLFAINKVVLGFFIATIASAAIMLLGGRKQALVPSGIQNIAESSVDFIRSQVVLQTMGPDGMAWVPFLLTLFFFILFNNLFEVIPGWQMPGNARMAMPLFMALLVWLVFNVVGVIKQGPLGYLKSVLFPPGVPIALYILVTPIEFVSTFLVRPFSLAVRLFANLLAGHILLVTFAILSAAMWSIGPSLVILPLPALVLILLTAFEVMVAFLQAYIFTILTAVYIGGAMHPEH